MPNKINWEEFKSPSDCFALLVIVPTQTGQSSQLRLRFFRFPFLMNSIITFHASRITLPFHTLGIKKTARNQTICDNTQYARTTQTKRNSQRSSTY